MERKNGDAIFLAQNPFERSRYSLIDRSLAHLEGMPPKAKARAAAHKLDAVDLNDFRVTPEELAAARKLIEEASDPTAARKNNMAQLAHWAKANNIEKVLISRGSTREKYLELYLATE